MYRLRWYCWEILSGGRFSELHTIYQGCRALPFALARLSCLHIGVGARMPVCFPWNVALLPSALMLLTVEWGSACQCLDLATAELFSAYLAMTELRDSPWKEIRKWMKGTKEWLSRLLTIAKSNVRYWLLPSQLASKNACSLQTEKS